MHRILLAILSVLCAIGVPNQSQAETGYDLWLRYKPLDSATQAHVSRHAQQLVVVEEDQTLSAATEELQRGLLGLTGKSPSVSRQISADGAILIGTARTPAIAALNLPLGKVGREGYLIRSANIDGKRTIVVVGNEAVGALYGTFALLKHIQLGKSLDALDVADSPKLQLRVLNHWDNLNRHVERGYSGWSIWDWQKLPDYKDPRYKDYARANASLGINGIVLTNVNANAQVLKRDWLEKVRALAEVFRPYGIKVYLTARFSAPIELDGLKTADPLNPDVAKWWKAKIDEIYTVIPDFGGLLVKANSEGQPGPNDYGRSHAEGANMMADALLPHGGVLMWRAFVYQAENKQDRHMQAHAEFIPLDGTFRDNVMVQVKNGAIDFQPREPFHPMFGAMPRTPLMMEFQITKEYLGFATHLAYLGTMWEEALRADTYRPEGNRVANVLMKPVAPGAVTGMAGVANVGTDLNWSGSQFDQANWYAYGRFAWNPEDKAEPIAREWATLTWGRDPALVNSVVKMMMGSQELVVDYMTPLGLTHLMATGHHYGPGPWVDDLDRPEWNPVYYHRASPTGIGFDRTRTGSDALSQYAPEYTKLWGNPKTIPEELLLWFHHVSWDHRMKSGRTLWDELVVRYDRGVAGVVSMQAEWERLQGKVDARRWAEVRDFLTIQQKEAKWWRDASIAYFQSISKRPLPAGHAAPPHSLEYYKSIDNRYAPGNGE